MDSASFEHSQGQQFQRNVQHLTVQDTLPLNNVNDTERVFAGATQVDTMALLKDTGVLMYGETHTNYAIPDHLLEQIAAFKAGGVTSFGFEINPDPKLLKIFNDINAGNVDRVEEIDWSLGFGNPTVRQTKQRMVVQLVKAGIRVYPFASWNRQENIEPKPYTKESEEEAADIISQQASDGKTVVLVGNKHAEYRDNRKVWSFPHTADCVKSRGINVTSVTVVGGMEDPRSYDRSPEELLRRGYNQNNLHGEMIIDTSAQKINGFHSDRILVLPTVSFLATNKPVPTERTPIGEFTPLGSVQPVQAIEEIRGKLSALMGEDNEVGR